MSEHKLLRRPLKSAKTLAGRTPNFCIFTVSRPSMSRVGNPYANAKAESFMKNTETGRGARSPH